MLAEKIFGRMPTALIYCAQWPRVLFYRCISTNVIKGRPTRYQPLHCAGRGEIIFDERVRIGVFPSPFFLSTHAYIEARNPSARVAIGTGTWLNNNFCAIAEHSSITIGKKCLVGANVEILDSAFHGISIENRAKSLPEWSQPVVIGDNVFIGSNVKIMKGVCVGDGSIIANGSIVTKDVPPGMIACGNPAKVLRAIGPGE